MTGILTQRFPSLPEAAQQVVRDVQTQALAQIAMAEADRDNFKSALSIQQTLRDQERGELAARLREMRDQLDRERAARVAVAASRNRWREQAQGRPEFADSLAKGAIIRELQDEIAQLRAEVAGLKEAVRSRYGAALRGD